ncbi:hypothetical protein BC829DRAFT_437340 [Chytridium lagenaria]|nr:hypothetical protein BC829DRAFT_437340 [Chytridium lagenaria]
MLTRNNVFLERVSQELRSFGRKAQAPIFNGSIRPGLEIPMFFVSRLDDIHAASVTKGWRKAVAHLFLKRNLFSEQPWITTANYLQTECDLDASILPHVLNILLSFGILSGVKNTEDCSSDQIRYTVTEDVLTKVVEKSGHRLNEAFGNNVSSDKNRRNLQSFLSEYLATLSAPSYETEIRTERSFHALSLRKDFTKPIYQSSLNIGSRCWARVVVPLELCKSRYNWSNSNYRPECFGRGSSGESSEEGEVSDVEGVTPIFPAKSVAIKALGQWAMKNKQSIEYEFEQFPQVGFRAKLSFMQDNARIEFVSASQHSRKVAAKEEVAKMGSWKERNLQLLSNLT